MLQEFINKQFYNLFCITLLFGIIFYDIIGFNSTDEICGLLLLTIFLYHMFKTSDWPINKFFLITLGVFLFYFCYSIYIGSNTKKAILIDLIIQMKPYLAFFCTYQLMPRFNDSQKKILKDTCLCIWVLFIPIGLLGFINERYLFQIVGHPSCYVAIISTLSLTYLYCSEYTKRDKVIFLIMLAVGIASGRSKFYGFYAIAIFMITYLNNINKIQLNAKNSIALIMLFIAIAFVAREKIDLYFLQGLAEEDAEDNDMIARFVLYTTSFKLFIDYIPFGSGLASFATHASAVYYSNIYTKYSIDYVWGLSKAYNKFISDTYYPSLAQFGIAGVMLFALFWIYIMVKSMRFGKIAQDAKLFILTILIIGYLLIENIADASFTSNRGLFMMMFLGLVAANQKAEAKQVTQSKQIQGIKND